MTQSLLVCSGGGHLKQLYAFTERIGIPPSSQLWITFDNGLSRSLLADRAVVFAPFAAPRDAVNILRLRMLASMFLARTPFERAISTGSSPAVAFLPLAARKGIRSYYIESAARANGPSMSGRLVARNPAIRTFTQYPAWADDHWAYRGSIFDSFASGPTTAPRTIRRAVVTVGTQEGYAFDRLYRALVPLLADCDEVLWQTGTQDVSRFGIEGRAVVPNAEMKAAIAEADVVIAHAGTGSALTAIEHGRVPVLVPRLVRHHEHVDDHQLQIAAELHGRGLALMRHAEELTMEDLEAAAARSTVRVPAPPFVLDDADAQLAASTGRHRA
jgi:UDP-N-acetylglucosamine--N-acetylmuramyl-(pentapeptide) pyrophosphoryl-undecaprenol N-acetylglucosamine transferase